MKATEGPYRDLDPAVRFAAPRLDMAVVDADASDPTAWRYTLTTTRDETVSLVIHLPPDPDLAHPVRPTGIEVHISPVADGARERRLAQEIESRLKALRKTGIAKDPDA